MLIFAFPFFVSALINRSPRPLTKFCCTSLPLLKCLYFYAILIQSRVQELQSQLNVEIRTHQQAREQLLTSTRDIDSVELRVRWRIYSRNFCHKKLLTSNFTEIQKLFSKKRENDWGLEFCDYSAHKLKPSSKQRRNALLTFWATSQVFLRKVGISYWLGFLAEFIRNGGFYIPMKSDQIEKTLFAFSRFDWN